MRDIKVSPACLSQDAIEEPKSILKLATSFPIESEVHRLSKQAKARTFSEIGPCPSPQQSSKRRRLSPKEDPAYSEELRARKDEQISEVQDRAAREAEDKKAGGNPFD